nr:DUF3298 domain-containing protein [uncultured Carboxylicivirga sp.]
MRSTLLLSSALLLLVSCNSAKKSEKKWKFENKTISNESDIMTQTIQYPVFTNDFVDGVITNIITEWSDEFKSEIGTESVSENWKSEQSINAEVFISDNGELSILFSNYLFTGGAHGNTLLKSCSFDSEGKEVLNLSNIIKGKYFGKLQELSRKKLKVKLGYEGFVDDGTQTIGDFSVFVLSSDSISFYFSQYQVASYADGIQKVSFPMSIFAPNEELN